MDEECKHGLRTGTCSLCSGRLTAQVKPKRFGHSTASQARRTPLNSSSYFSYSWDQWHEMCDVGGEVLIEHARQRSAIRYGVLWLEIQSRLGRDLGSSWRKIDHLLEYISDRTYESVGLFLTALVVDEKDGEIRPSEGFFRLAAARGALPEEDAPPVGEKWTKMSPPQRAFWQIQLDALYSKFAEVSP
jgi:hypothetical protein